MRAANPFARVVLSLSMTVALGIVLVASSPPAAATGTLDQSQEAQTDLNGVALVGSQIAAQTFTAGRQGALDQVDLLLTRLGNPGSLTIEIRTADAGVPTSQVIASGAVVDTTLDTDPYTYEWVSVVLSPAALVSSGTQYAIVVRDAGGAIFPTDYFLWAEADLDPYTNGLAATSVDGGATWFPATSVDFAFRTYVSTAGAATCRAKDGTVSNSNLQAIIDGARTGDKIVVTGVCVGNFLIPGGGSAASLTLVGWKAAILDGNSSGSVLSVGSGEIVTISNLLITNGSASDGGGIYNSGTVNLCRSTKVNGNTASNGGGIYNSGGIITMSGNAQVNDNTADFAVAGIYNSGGIITMSGNAQVNDNTNGYYYGGGIYNDGGTLTMSGRAQVNGNWAGAYGGGIENFGTLTMSGRAQVNGNSAYLYFGGGIYNGGTLTMSGWAQVNGNSAEAEGGGIYNDRGTIKMRGRAQVNGNSVDVDAGGIGGGIFNDGTLVGAFAGVNVKANIPDDIAP